MYHPPCSPIEIAPSSPQHGQGHLAEQGNMSTVNSTGNGDTSGSLKITTCWARRSPSVSTRSVVSLSLSLTSPPPTAPSPGRPPCTWKELYRQARWFVTTIPHDVAWLDNLRSCCKYKNWLGVRRLCTRHEYKDSEIPCGWHHPLAQAAGHSVDCMRILLIELHGDTKWMDDVGDTLIHYAGHCAETIICLRDEFGLSVDTLGMSGETILHRAVWSHDVPSARWV